MFRTVSLSIIRSLVLYTQQQIQVMQVMLCVQCQTPDDGQRYFSEHVQPYSKNKFDGLVVVVGFIIRIHHGPLNVKYCNLFSDRDLYIWYGPLVASLSSASFKKYPGERENYVQRSRGFWGHDKGDKICTEMDQGTSSIQNFVTTIVFR